MDNEQQQRHEETGGFHPLNVTPLDLTANATYYEANRRISDPQEYMAICAGPAYPDINPTTYKAYVDLHSNGSTTTTIFNPALDSVGPNSFNAGYGYEYDSSPGVIKSTVKTFDKDRKYARSGNLSILVDYNAEVQAGIIPHGMNAANVAGPNTLSSMNFILGTRTFDTAFTTPPDVLLFNFFYNTYSDANNTDGCRITVVNARTLNSNIRNNVPFPNHPQKIPKPTTEIVYLDLSNCDSTTLTTPANAMQLAKFCPWATHYNNTLHVNDIYIVDLSNTCEGVYQYSALPGAISVDWTTSPFYARILDQTLSNADIKMALFDIAVPLCRSMNSTALQRNSTDASLPSLHIGIAPIDWEDQIIKWVAKNRFENTAWILTTLVADSAMAAHYIRDIRVCKTFLIQVASYMRKVSYIPDSNVLITPARLEQTIGFNLGNMGVVYTISSTDAINPFSKWFAWIPYELAKSTNNEVNFDSVNWRVSRMGKKIADKARRSRSIAFQPVTNAQAKLQYFNQIDNPIDVITNYSSTLHLTVRSIPISIYWESTKFPIYTIEGWSEDDLVEENFLVDHNFFPADDIESTWN